MSLSLDGESPESTRPTTQIGKLETALTSTPTPPQPPPLAESSGGDSPAPTLSSDSDADVPTAVGNLAEASGEVRIELALVEEDTESAQIPLPPPLQLTLKDEVLPWPPLLVAPTLVLPGAWPPPPGTLARSAPSLIDHARDSLVEISIEAETGAMSVGSVSMELVIEEDSTADDEIGGMQFASSSELPPVKGTLDEMPVVVSATPDEFDDIPTEVSQRDALEEALALLRTAAPGSPLGTTVEEDDESATTAEDLVSLELDAPISVHGPVDPAVRADLDASPGAAGAQRVALHLGDPVAHRGALLSPVWIDLVLTAPATESATPVTPLPPAPSPPAAPRPLPPLAGERTTDLVALAERREAEVAAISAPVEGVAETSPSDLSSDADGDDWLSDLPDEDPLN